jgi:hypothetical protein
MTGLPRTGTGWLTTAHSFRGICRALFLLGRLPSMSRAVFAISMTALFVAFGCGGQTDETVCEAGCLCYSTPATCPTGCYPGYDSTGAFFCGNGPPPAGSCASNADCPVGLECAFAVSAGCAATGTCRPFAGGGSCAIEPACTCAGTTDPSPECGFNNTNGVYAHEPIAHDGPCSDGGPMVGVEASTVAESSDDAQVESSFPACSWPTPTVPPNDGPVEVSANRTVLMCGVGTVNNTFCLSESKTECTPVSVYGPCEQQCSPCRSLCATNEYAIGAGMPEYSQLPAGGYPFQSPNIPSNCRTVLGEPTPELPAEGFFPPPGGGDLFWGYWCCPCQ